jgi:pimeloyl-ACP methyl ester carboxylesterase
MRDATRSATLASVTTVFVHGALETGEVWDELRGCLHADSIALRLPGIAGPPPAGFGATKDDYADWLHATLTRIHGPIDLVGHAWGALLALRIATAFPLPLRSWAGDAAYGFHPDYTWPLSVRTALQDGAIDAWLRDGPDRLARLGVTPALARSMAAAHTHLTSESLLALHHSALPNVHADWGGAAAKPTPAPGLVLLAAADPYGDESLAVEVADRLGARKVRFDDLGHSWMVEDPRLVAEALLTFWTSLR